MKANKIHYKNNYNLDFAPFSLCFMFFKLLNFSFKMFHI